MRLRLRRAKVCVRRRSVALASGGERPGAPRAAGNASGLRLHLAYEARPVPRLAACTDLYHPYTLLAQTLASRSAPGAWAGPAAGFRQSGAVSAPADWGVTRRGPAARATWRPDHPEPLPGCGSTPRGSCSPWKHLQRHSRARVKEAGAAVPALAAGAARGDARQRPRRCVPRPPFSPAASRPPGPPVTMAPSLAQQVWANFFGPIEALRGKCVCVLACECSTLVHAWCHSGLHTLST